MEVPFSKEVKEYESITVEQKKWSWAYLMYRASLGFSSKLSQLFDLKQFSRIIVIAGNGNNGADGILAAEMLSLWHNIKIDIWHSKYMSQSSSLNKYHLKSATHNNLLNIYQYDYEAVTYSIDSNTLIIDAFFGIGFNRPLDVKTIRYFKRINRSFAKIVSLDIPSGMYPDKHNDKKDTILRSDRVITFQYPKRSYFLNDPRLLAKTDIVDIGLITPKTDKNQKWNYTVSKSEYIVIADRSLESYKTKHGKVLVIGGAKGMYGAAYISARAANVIGVGYSQLWTSKGAKDELEINGEIMMNFTDDIEHISVFPQNSNFTYAIGPGLGRHEETKNALITFLDAQHSPIIIDADALRLIAENDLSALIPKNSILTPHLGEFKSLIKKEWATKQEKLELQQSLAQELECIIVLKGPNTSVVDTKGNIYFNSTGNPALAVAGSGDVLTGVISGLLAQNHSPLKAAILGTYIHGLAADIYAEEYHERSLTPSILIDYLSTALTKMKHYQIRFQNHQNKIK